LQLVERGGAFVIHDAEELRRTMLNLLEDETARTTAGARAAAFVRANLGATERILAHLDPYLHGTVPEKQP
jgi:3-deoxy-D-manno-octulosonic-acid transferase